MSKKAVISINALNSKLPINFKKHVLLFDELVIEKNSLELAKLLATHDQKSGELFYLNNREIGYLGNEGYLQIESVPDIPISVTVENPEDARFLINLNNENKLLSKMLDEYQPNSSSKDTTKEIAKKIAGLPESLARALSIDLRSKGFDAYPFLNFDPYSKFSSNKSDVLKIVLKKIPEPDDTVSWEQILDFKKDPDTMKKYYALVKWVNDVAKKEFKLNEIEDEYNYLYHEYSEQYRIHKLKYNQGTIQILVTAAIDVLTLNLGLGQVSSSLFTLWKNQLSLLEAESKFTGREIAYIHKLNQSSISGK